MNDYLKIIELFDINKISNKKIKLIKNNLEVYKKYASKLNEIEDENFEEIFNYILKSEETKDKLETSFFLSEYNLDYPNVDGLARRLGESFRNLILEYGGYRENPEELENEEENEEEFRYNLSFQFGIDLGNGRDTTIISTISAI